MAGSPKDWPHKLGSLLIHHLMHVQCTRRGRFFSGSRKCTGRCQGAKRPGHEVFAGDGMPFEPAPWILASLVKIYATLTRGVSPGVFDCNRSTVTTRRQLCR
eukprot:352454-Chlamydomonas_euryale.AAC.10